MSILCILYIHSIFSWKNIAADPGERTAPGAAERKLSLNIIISNQSGKPLYEQITDQIKALILEGSLEEGDALPSMRVLAKDLRISLITTKRAYEELEREGFIVSVPGKGSFVARKNLEFVREEQMRRVESHLSEAVKAAALCGLSYQELAEVLRLLFDASGEQP